jgi:hypothetical protein
MEAPLDGPITRAAYKGTREANNYREPIREYNSAMAFASAGAEVKSPPGNDAYYFRIHSQNYHVVSQPYPRVANKPEHGQVCFFILLKEQQNGPKTNQTKGVWSK